MPRKHLNVGQTAVKSPKASRSKNERAQLTLPAATRPTLNKKTALVVWWTPRGASPNQGRSGDHQNKPPKPHDVAWRVSSPGDATLGSLHRFAIGAIWILFCPIECFVMLVEVPLVHVVTLEAKQFPYNKESHMRSRCGARITLGPIGRPISTNSVTI